MPQYALIGTHPHDTRPVSNKSVREFVKKMMPEIPKLAEGLGIKILIRVILEPSHKNLMRARKLRLLFHPRTQRPIL